MAKFEPGKSGNPKGRPKFTDKISRLRQQIAAEIPEILAALVDQAKAVDATSAKLLLDRCLPPMKPESRPLPPAAPVDPAGVVAALSDGSLTAEQAREIMALLADKARIGEALENSERLERIEELLSPK